MRFRVGDVCEHNAVSWVNVSGGNSEPGLGPDWLKKNSVVEVLDVLTSNETGKALSANQGRALKALIDAIQVPAISDNLTTADATKTLSANQGKILKDYIDAINAILSSDDVTLDELQEVVDYIKVNRQDLANLSISNIAGLVDALAAKANDSEVIKNIKKTDGSFLFKDANGVAFLPELFYTRKIVTDSDITSGRYTLSDADNHKVVIFSVTSDIEVVFSQNAIPTDFRFKGYVNGDVTVKLIVSVEGSEFLSYPAGTKPEVKRQSSFFFYRYGGVNSANITGDLELDTDAKPNFNGYINISQATSPVYYQAVTAGNPIVWGTSAKQTNGANGHVKVNGSQMAAFPSDWVVIGDSPSTTATDVNFIWWHFVNGEMQVVCKVISTSTTDTEAPTVPSNLSSSNETTTTFDASWSNSTDNVGVTGYDLEIDGVVVSNVVSPFSSTGNQGGKAVSVRVRAKDAAGNVSAWSTIKTVYLKLLAPQLTLTPSDGAIYSQVYAKDTDGGIDGPMFTSDGIIVERATLSDFSDAVEIYSSVGSEPVSDASQNSVVPNGETRYFRAKVYDSAGNHATSDWMTGSTTAGAGATPEAIVWEQLVNATDLGSGTLDFLQPNPTSPYDDGGYATKAINGNNGVTWGAPATTAMGAQGVGLTNTYAGLATDNFNMDIVVLINTSSSSRKLLIYEDGVSKQATEPYASADQIELIVEGTTVKVAKNGTVIYTSAKTFTLPLTPIGVGIASTEYPDSQIVNAQFTDNTNLVTSPL